jgi:murein DD-endopeptidase MepM/ murein hydrolase activator NlpD
VLVLTACASSSRQIVVEDRTSSKTQQPEAAATAYSVVAGDTLSSIARRFGVSVQALQHHNKMVDPHQLEVGDRLLIPGGGSRSLAASTPGFHSAFSWPLASVQITSAFGSRGGAHKGVDMDAAKGARIRAAADGVVIFSGRQHGYGRVVILQHGGDIRTLYAHNRKNKVKVGQRVVRGETIAKVGASGNASGAHLHFEYIRSGRQVDPQQYIYR